MANLFYVANGDGQKLSPAVPRVVAVGILERIQNDNPGLYYDLKQAFSDAPIYKTPDELYTEGSNADVPVLHRSR